MRPLPRAVATAASLLSVCALAGCAGQDAQATTPPADPPAADPGPRAVGNVDDSPGLPANGAPEVGKPINDTKLFQENPCNVLSPEQVRTLRVAQDGVPRHGSTGPACDWKNPETGANTGIQWVEHGGTGLSGAYAGRGGYDLFEELPEIDGIPVVAYDVVDAREVGACPLLVGVTDKLSFQVESGQARGDVGKIDACETSRSIATMMLTTMKGG